MALDHDLGLGRHLERHGLAVDEIDALAAQQPGELVLGERVGHGRHRRQDRAGIRADHRRGGQRLALAALLPALVVLGAAAMLEPAHQRRVPAGHLRAVDAEIEAVLALGRRPLGDDQRPGDQWRRLAGPAGLHRQAGKVDVVAGEHDLLAGRGSEQPRGRLHGEHGLGQRQQFEGLAPALGRLRLAQEGERLADFAQLCRRAVHAPGDALDRAEEIDEDRDRRGRAIGAQRRLEQDGRPLLGEQPGLDLGHLEDGRDRFAHTHEAPLALEMGDELA